MARVTVPAIDSCSARSGPRSARRRAALLIGVLVFAASTVALWHQYAFEQHLSGETCVTCIAGHALDNAISNIAAAAQYLLLPTGGAGTYVSARPRELPTHYEARGPPLYSVI